MIAFLRRSWPTIVCLLACYALLGWAVSTSSRTTAGRLTYRLDDTYIHMAMAKNFSEHGVWGITRHGFTSSTSSPLYTGLLAACFFLGHHEAVPLALNVSFATALIVYLRRLIPQDVPPAAVLMILLAVTLGTSVPALTLIGMEHVMHAGLTLAFVSMSAAVLAAPDTPISAHRGLFLIAALLPMARYEGCFAIAVVCGFLMLQGRVRFAILLALAGALPVLSYGIVSCAHGWLIVPNSILLKGAKPHLPYGLRVFGSRSVSMLLKHPMMLLLLMLTLTACLGSDRTAESKVRSCSWWRCTIFLCILFMHLQTADMGWLFRYEAYLVAVGLAITLPQLARTIGPLFALPSFGRMCLLPTMIPLVGVAALSAPLVQRGWLAWRDTQLAMHDRYLEHIQPARFLNAHYPGATVVANDINAIAYFTDCRILDMYGLGSMEPVRFRLGDSAYTGDKVRDWTESENADIAILQVEWWEINTRIPDSWIPVAEWKIPRNVVFGDLRIGWFAVRPTAAEPLASRLLAFRPNLPEAIEMTMLGPREPRHEGGGD